MAVQKNLQEKVYKKYPSYKILKINKQIFYTNCGSLIN